MEPHLLQAFVTFGAGLIVGIIIMLLVNKLKSGSMTPSKVKQEYQDYQEKVEEHFEETSKKFKDMTEQYQDLYKHLSVGATSLCRPDSVAAVLADNSEPAMKLENKSEEVKEPVKEEAVADQKKDAQADDIAQEDVSETAKSDEQEKEQASKPA